MIASATAYLLHAVASRVGIASCLVTPNMFTTVCLFRRQSFPSGEFSWYQAFGKVCAYYSSPVMIAGSEAHRSIPQGLPSRSSSAPRTGARTLLAGSTRRRRGYPKGSRLFVRSTAPSIANGCGSLRKNRVERWAEVSVASWSLLGKQANTHSQEEGCARPPHEVSTRKTICSLSMYR